MYEIWKDGVLETTKASLVSACMTAKASAQADRRTYEVYRVICAPIVSNESAAGTTSSGGKIANGEKQKIAVYRTQRDMFRIWMA